MQIIPLQAVPNQTLTVLLGGQNCRVNVYTKAFGLYLDLAVGDTPIRLGVICQHANRLVRYAYLGFIGDLFFFDTQAKTDPVYSGLGSRYQLTYLDAAEVASL
jgi:hypothetical protein